MLLPSRNFIDNFFNDPFFERPFEHAASQIMKTDIHENDNSYLVEMELPGYKKEDIKAISKTAISPSPLRKTRPRKNMIPEESASARSVIPAPATAASMLARS